MWLLPVFLMRLLLFACPSNLHETIVPTMLAPAHISAFWEFSYGGKHYIKTNLLNYSYLWFYIICSQHPTADRVRHHYLSSSTFYMVERDTNVNLLVLLDFAQHCLLLVFSFPIKLNLNIPTPYKWHIRSILIMNKA